MFRSIFSKESNPVKVETARVVTETEAFETPAVWDSQKLKDEIIAYQAPMAYMVVDRAATDPVLRDGIIDNINRILNSECGIKFATTEELE